MTAGDQVKYHYEDSDDSCRSFDWKKQTDSIIKGAILQGSSGNSSTRKPTKALAEYNAKLAAKATVNFQE